MLPIALHQKKTIVLFAPLLLMERLISEFRSCQPDRSVIKCHIYCFSSNGFSNYWWLSSRSIRVYICGFLFLSFLLIFFRYDSLKKITFFNQLFSCSVIQFIQEGQLTLLFEIQIVWIWEVLQPLFLPVDEGSWFRKHSMGISSACKLFSNAISWILNVSCQLSLYSPSESSYWGHLPWLHLESI